MGLSTKVGPPKDFVASTRTADLDYMPVGITPPSRNTTVLKPDELAKATEQLDATRAAHDKLAGRKPPPATAAPVKKPSTKKQDEKPASTL